MKFVSKLSVISLLVLMFSFMNIANAANDGDCMGTTVDTCDQAKKPGACQGSFRPGNPGIQCVWDSSTSLCRATGGSCYGPKCDTSGNVCRSKYSCQKWGYDAVSACRSG